jgi:hypothetical protein
MTTSVVHAPRVAWDGALAFVEACENVTMFTWFKGEVWQLLGPAYYDMLNASHLNLWYADDERVHQIEAGIWRVRLSDALAGQPELAGPLLTLIGEVRERAALKRGWS